jgi:hypothetical protein
LTLSTSKEETVVYGNLSKLLNQALGLHVKDNGGNDIWSTDTNTDDLNYINSLSAPLGSFLFLKQIYKSILYAQCGLFLRVIMQVCLHTWDQFVSMRLRAMWAKAMLTNY